MAKVLELQLQHQSFQWIFRVDFFRMDWFILLAVQATLKSLQHQFESINSSALSLLYDPTSHICTWLLGKPVKTIALTRWTLVGKGLCFLRWILVLCLICTWAYLILLCFTDTTFFTNWRFVATPYCQTIVSPFLAIKFVFLSCFVFDALCSLQDLSSPTRDLSRAYGSENS